MPPFAKSLWLLLMLLTAVYVTALVTSIVVFCSGPEMYWLYWLIPWQVPQWDEKAYGWLCSGWYWTGWFHILPYEWLLSVKYHILLLL